MSVWVHIVPVIVPDPDSNEAKSALTESLKTSISRTLVALTSEALPPDKYDAKPADKPKGKPKDFNAIKITEKLKLKVETAGSQLTVFCDVTAEFEAIKAPKLTDGDLLVQVKKGAGVQNRGSGEKAIAAFAEQALAEVVKPLVRKAIDNPTFNSYAKNHGLDL
jgi:hypothetical protein